MTEIPKHEKIGSFIIVLAALGAIAAGILFSVERSGDERDQKSIKAEVTGANTGRQQSLAGILENEAAEEAIEKDAGRLEMKTDENESAPESAGQQAEATEHADPSDIAPLPQPEPIPQSSAGELKFGLITDVHARSNSNGSGQRILKDFFLDGLNHFIGHMNTKFRPNFVVSNGDLIEGTDRSSDVGKKELALIKNILDRTPAPKYWIVGNHELRSVTKSQWKKSLGIDYLRKAFEVGDYRIVILDSNFTAEDKDVDPDNFYTRGKVSEEELDWLDEELSKSDKKTIVFMHHPPLWNVNMKTDERLPGNAPEIQEIFARRRVLAVFAGHFEDLYVGEIDGVKYIALPGFIKNDKYQKTFSEITIQGEEIVIDMSYVADGQSYRTVRITE